MSDALHHPVPRHARRASRVPHALAALGCASLALPLACYAYLGLFSRYAADDYCTAGQLAQNGLLGMQLELYQGWSGRFSFTFAVGLLELLGPGVVLVLPLLAMLTWLGALGWLVLRLPVVVGGWPPLLAAALLSLTLVYATLSSTPDLGQSLLWQTGVLTYIAPLILLTVLAGVIAGCVGAGRSGWAQVGACFVLGLLAGGTSETSVSVAVAALAAASVVVAVLGSSETRRIGLPLVLAALIGSLVALAIVIAAPGNAVRSSAHRPDVIFAITAALADSRQFVHDWWRFTTFSMAVALLVPAGLALLDPAPRVDWRRLVLWSAIVVAVGLVLIVVALLPSFYALGVPQPGRARVIPQFILALVTATLGYTLGALVRSAWPRAATSRGVLAACSVVFVGLMVLGPLRSAQAALGLAADARAFAARWDEVDQQLRAARASGLVDARVPLLSMDGTIRGMDFYSRDASDWLNVCAARYYGLRSIRAE